MWINGREFCTVKHTRNPKRRFPWLLLWVGVRMPFVILSRLWSSAAVSVIGWLKSTLILRLLMLLEAWIVRACSRITTWEFPNAVQTFTVGCVRSGNENWSNWCVKVAELGTNLMIHDGIIFSYKLPTKTYYYPPVNEENQMLCSWVWRITG